MAGHQTENTEKKSSGTSKYHNLLIYFVFVVLSFFLWLLLFLDKTLTTTIDIKYRFTNIPEGIVIEEEPTGKIPIEIEGRGYDMLQEKLKIARMPMIINLKNEENKNIIERDVKNGKIYIVTQKMLPNITKKIGDKVKVVRLNSDTIFYSIVDMGQKMVPIDVSTIHYELQPGVRETQRLILSQDSVMIFGQKQIIDSITSIAVAPRKLKNVSVNTSFSFNLVQPKDVSLSENTVRANIFVEKYTETKLKLKVNMLNFPQEYESTLMPEFVVVSCNVPLAYYDDIQDYEITVSADYNKAVNNSIPLECSTTNPQIHIVTCIPEVCSFILNTKIND